MAISVDRETCIGCESCVAVCPVGAMGMEEGKAKVDDNQCISCGACVSECPVEAISFGAAENTAAAAEAKDEKSGDAKDLWVVAELENGEPLEVTYELLGVTSGLAAKAGEKCCAVVIGAAAGDAAQKLIARGADMVYVVEGAQYGDYNTDLYTQAVCQLAQEYKPNAVLFGATADGRDLAPRVAARLHTGLCADCTALDIQAENKIVEWTRPALGGNILATILCDEHRPQMGTVRPKVFKAQAADVSRSGEIVKFNVSAPVVSSVQLMRKESLNAANAIKIEDAEVICSGGRGMGCLDNFKMLEELASLFENGAVAGSRAVVDEGWINHAQQVGQSGKTVTPKIYFACGISGAIQHISGMNDSDIIIAVNKDEQAPIFKIAQYGIVGDACQILPRLIAKIKAYKEA